MWIKLRCHVDGGGVIQNTNASIRHTTTAICFFETDVLVRVGDQRASDQRAGPGDIQKVAEDDNELAEEDDEECLEGRSNCEKD